MEHNKIQRDYKNMDYIILKHQKELEEFKKDIGNVY